MTDQPLTAEEIAALRAAAGDEDTGYVAVAHFRRLLATLDATRERPSALDVEQLATEPDAGEGTGPPSPDGEPIDPPFLIAVPTPATTEATLRAARTEQVRSYRGHCLTHGKECRYFDAAVQPEERCPTCGRFISHDHTVQPEGGPE